MRWCAQHWGQLRVAIDARGLTPLVDSDADERKREIERAIRKREPVAVGEFDPLFKAFWVINTEAFERIGDRAIGRCPLCMLGTEDGHAGLARVWIAECCDAQALVAHCVGRMTLQ